MDLQTHPDPDVTVSALARYWGISLKQIYRLIDNGSLETIRLGPRQGRIRTADAIRFQRSASTISQDDGPPQTVPRK